jgi:hypothetical protein
MATEHEWDSGGLGDSCSRDKPETFLKAPSAEGFYRIQVSSLFWDRS